MKYLILAQTEVTARALGVWLEILGEPRVEDPGKDSRCLLLSHLSAHDREAGVLTYEILVAFIERESAGASTGIHLNEIVILVDSVRIDRLNAITEGSEWSAIVAMLILTFPEIRWVFGVLSSAPTDWLAGSKGWHELSSLIAKPRRDPLFDPTGLRDLVRSNTNPSSRKPSGNPDAGGLPRRIKLAAAIDEEQNYALFHAYTAYRFGFRADAVRSWALMRTLFHREQEADSTKTEGHGFHLLFEDVNLNFPDKRETVHLSEFDEFEHEEHGRQGRATHCSMLGYPGEGEDSQYRILVTSGHSGADPGRVNRNLAFVSRNKRNGAGLVLKPVGGMFDLWTGAKLFKRLGTGSQNGMNSRGLAPGYFWPPPRIPEQMQSHSAPGKLMLIAQTILRRADAQFASDGSVEGAIWCAVMATDALELLRYQTPTLALQALARKHEFEIRAEVTFLGVGHHFDVDLRFRELERETAAAARHYGKKRARTAALDALVSIGSRLMLVFRDAGHFDEEMSCLTKVRRWHRRMKLLKAQGPIDLAVNAVMAYAEWLLVNPARFLAALACWFLLFWAIAHSIPPSATEAKSATIAGATSLVSAASEAWNTFMVANPGSTGDALHLLFIAVASATGLLHLGIFISYLYSSVTRR